MIANAVSADAVRADAHRHVPAYDGVRGIAILLVLLYHFASSLTVLGLRSPVLNLFDFGWCGVDVFFALSGFLITGILLDTKSSPHYFKSFYARRVLRIFPLYYGALLIVILLRAGFGDAGVWGIYGAPWAPGSLLWPALFLQNAAMTLQGTDATGITAHYWSLAVEEHFYLVWPLLIWLAPRRWAIALALLTVAGSITGRILILHRGMDINFLFSITPLRMDAVAIGALGAMLLRAQNITVLMRAAGPILVLTTTLLTALFVLHKGAYQSDPILWVWAYSLTAICTTAGLIASLAGGFLARLLSLRLLRWFGKYSFGLYVWHPIIGMLAFHSKLTVVPAGASPATILMITASIFLLNLVIAWTSYHLWEKRFLDLKRYVPATAGPAVPARDVAALSPASGS